MCGEVEAVKVFMLQSSHIFEVDVYFTPVAHGLEIFLT